jgi:hypothetical protein
LWCHCLLTSTFVHSHSTTTTTTTTTTTAKRSKHLPEVHCCANAHCTGGSSPA